MSANTLFLRLEGPLQSWGVQESKFVIRRSSEAPTKSGIFGLLCAALGVSRRDAPSRLLPELSSLQMGVRIDRPGVRWWDYHTVGAGLKMRTAEGGSKDGPILTRREYLCDASFLAALKGEQELIGSLADALKEPVWTTYLGRKSCPPSRPIFEQVGEFADISIALQAIPWVKRFSSDTVPTSVDCFIDWQPGPNEPEAPEHAEIWYDIPCSFEPPSHIPRFVIRGGFTVGSDGQIGVCKIPIQKKSPRPLWPRADYTNSEYKKRRVERIQFDEGLCVFCKAPATTVQHVTYRDAGGNETKDQLRSLCRLCHDAVTMIEYGLGMGLARINPEDERWRTEILEKRGEIVKFRSLETRRRHLDPQEVE